MLCHFQLKQSKRAEAALLLVLLKYENAEDVSEETGILVRTHLSPSTIPEAGIATFLDVDVKKGDIIRVQKAGFGRIDGGAH